MKKSRTVWLAIAVLFACTPFSGRAAEKVYSWKSIGLDKHDVLEFIAQPNLKTLYARTDKGLYSMTDGGAWAPVDLGVKGTVTTVLVSPAGTMYVALRENSFLRRNDKGVWERILWEEIDPIQFETAAFIGKSLIVVASASLGAGHETMVERGEVYASDDEGETWKLDERPIPSPQRLITLPNGALLVPKQSGQLVYFDANGKRLTTTPNSRTSPFGGISVPYNSPMTTIVVDKKKRAVFGGASVRASADLGKSWEDIIPLPKGTTASMYTPAGSPSTNRYTALADQNGELYLALDPSVTKIDKPTLVSVNLEQGNSLTHLGCSKSSGCVANYRRIHAIHAPAPGRIWVATDNGIFEVKEKRPVRFEVALGNGGVIVASNKTNGAIVPFHESSKLEGLNGWGEGDQIELKAVADPGFVFAGWKSPACAQADAAVCSFELSADTLVEATFKPAQP